MNSLLYCCVTYVNVHIQNVVVYTAKQANQTFFVPLHVQSPIASLVELCFCYYLIRISDKM
jgi:hypothetical protein